MSRTKLDNHIAQALTQVADCGPTVLPWAGSAYSVVADAKCSWHNQCQRTRAGMHLASMVARRSAQGAGAQLLYFRRAGTTAMIGKHWQ
jgi:hypothetical protein